MGRAELRCRTDLFPPSTTLNRPGLALPPAQSLFVPAASLEPRFAKRGTDLEAATPAAAENARGKLRRYTGARRRDEAGLKAWAPAAARRRC